MIVTHVPDFGKNFEGVLVKIQTHRSQTLYIASVYRPPDNKDAPLLALHEDLSKILDKDRVPYLVIGGDFNVPDANWETLSYPPSPSYSTTINDHMLDLSRDFGLTQMVNTPTREDNILDLLFCTYPGMASTPNTIPAMSDHQAVVMDINMKSVTTKRKARTVHIFKKENKEQMIKDLDQLQSTYLAACNQRTVEENWDHFKNGIMKAINDNIPTKKVYPGRDLPWITHHIKKQIKKKRILYRKAKRNRNLWQKYLEKEKEVKHQISESYL
jgi:hypothetical protein